MSAFSWWGPLAGVSLAVGAAFLGGLLIGQVALAVALVLAAMLARQLYMLERVRQWLRRDRVDLAPDAGGVWGELIGLIGRLFRRKQYHKRRMLQLLRELRSSTAAIADGVVMLNPAAEILWFNRAAARLLHLRGRTDIGLRVDNLVRRPEFVEYLRSGKYTIPVIVQAGGLSDQYLHFQIVPYGAGQLLGIEAQLHSAFGNLLENAVKYTAADGTIAMHWWRDEQGGHLSVRDTGIGIAAAHIPRLTERFYRVDPGRSRASGGSGLGLAIVKHVLQRHGARLQIESEEGKGSTFSCHFPPARLVPAG